IDLPVGVDEQRGADPARDHLSDGEAIRLERHVDVAELDRLPLDEVHVVEIVHGREGTHDHATGGREQGTGGGGPVAEGGPGGEETAVEGQRDQVPDVWMERLEVEGV